MFNNKYPYTDFHEMNLDWVLKTIKELESKVDNIEQSILEQANAYTDEQLAGYQTPLNQLRSDLIQMVNDVENDFDGLRTSVNLSLYQMDRKIDDLRVEMEQAIQGCNDRTDLAIEQNNVYLLGVMSQYLSNIKVLNALTGVYTTVQDMFNFLCTLHATDGITYTALAGKNNTYTQLANYGMTYTQLAMNGANIIQ